MRTPTIQAWYQNPKKHPIFAQFSNSPWTRCSHDLSCDRERLLSRNRSAPFALFSGRSGSTGTGSRKMCSSWKIFLTPLRTHIGPRRKALLSLDEQKRDSLLNTVRIDHRSRIVDATAARQHLTGKLRRGPAQLRRAYCGKLMRCRMT
jgi:hypothetical protein